MLSLAALSLPLPALKRTRGKPSAHACERVRMVTEDGRQGWDCPCRTGPHEVLVPAERELVRRAGFEPARDGVSRPPSPWA